MDSIVTLVIGILLMLPLAISCGKRYYRRYAMTKAFSGVMRNMFLEKHIERMVTMPVDPSQYASIVDNGIKTLAGGPGYKAGLLYYRNKQIYLTLIHLSGDIGSLDMFTKLIDSNLWLEAEVSALREVFLKDSQIGKLLHYEISFLS